MYFNNHFKKYFPTSCVQKCGLKKYNSTYMFSIDIFTMLMYNFIIKSR